MTKSYADTCLERAEKANNLNLASIPREFLKAQIDSAADVPELARRLKKACNLLGALKCSHWDTEWLADELEAVPEVNES